MRSVVAGDNEIMRRRAVVLFVAATLFSTVLATVFGGAGATAQIPADSAEGEVECPEPSPSPSPSETTDVVPTDDPTLPVGETEEECDEDDGDDDDSNNDGDGRDDDDENRPDDPNDPDKDDDDEKNDQGDRHNGSNDRRGDRDGKDKKDKPKRDRREKKVKDGTEKKTGKPSSKKFSATGDFDTDRLELIAAQLRARGVSEDEILERVYSPFIIGGPAAWTNTWGAPRYGPGPIVRTHEGQDVFCKYGDPVLAAEDGEIEFDEGGLGGKVARLYRKDGSYWYYAHLSGWNSNEFETGDQVETGDVIGYCGNSGNALTTPPHVHFGWYKASGRSRDPMGMLVKWLRIAERNAGVAYQRETGRSLDDISQTQSRRLFGDGFAPDISELKVSSEALLAATSSPGAGGMGLADVALQAALAAQEETAYDGEVEVEAEGAGDSHSELVELLESQSETASPDGPSGD
ncbi:MAG: M23 family metallopeptidase [Actinomycetota bacterium]|nr:M23 family metallopeptidase [Actinomycetota bacterium]